MELSLEKFVQQLEDSGILCGLTIEDLMTPGASLHDADQLARELVRRKKLTQFQVDEVGAGNGQSLALGNYVLVEKIGSGGMGQVYKAHHRRMDRFVAVKLLPDAMSKDPSAIARFEREVKAAAKITHPNIVAAYDADCANGVHFLVMEFVEGQDLNALVKQQGPCSADRALNYIVQAAKGMEAAHKKGIVHRDIKPANLLLDPEGTVKVLDMGLARFESAAFDVTTQTELTACGAVMGTVDYMSPEQAFNAMLADARADIYSLGCTFYYLIVGQAMYAGSSAIEKILAHREKPVPSLRAAGSDVSEQLEAIFKKMVAKRVEDRYQTMTQVLIDLQSCGSVIESLQSPQNAPATPDTSSQLIAETKVLPDPEHLITGVASIGVLFRRRSKTPVIMAMGSLCGLMLLAGLIVMVRNQSDPQIAATPVNVAGANRYVEALSTSAPADLSEQKSDAISVSDKPFQASPDRTPLFFQSPEFASWTGSVVAMPVQEQLDSVSQMLVKLNSGFDGKMRSEIQGDVVTGLEVLTDHITDISPLRALKNLKSLWCSASGPGAAKSLADLSPLSGTQIEDLWFNYTNVSDLSPLRGLKLNGIRCDGAKITSLEPLVDMPLTVVIIPRTRVSDLTPLRGMKIIELSIESTPVTDLSPLQGMPLNKLSMHDVKVKNLSVLKEMPLHFLCLDFEPERDAGLIRSITTLEMINIKPIAEFWKDVQSE